ncbi:hypothetical protein [uncultured Tenacibaculum sp.]|uniref:hypothetical protein n=1 Tax=uncultured Tenacibaculum sp. TaxID=174713 RepID=UPI0026183E3E|nr:hypothetical protein [uncultured Tenacibaculum sp.]
MDLQLKELSTLYKEFNADHKWIQTTSITQVKTSGRSMLHFQAELPLDGSNKGYFVRIKDEHGNIVKDTYHQRAATSNPVTGTIESNDLDFRSQIYTLEFGPHFTATNVNSVGATATIIQGRPRKFESSAVYYNMNLPKAVLFEYNVPPSIFDNNTDVKIYLVEGKDIKEERYAIENKVFKLSKSSYIGDGEISFQNALDHGKTYTLCMGIFSGVRQVAGNTFIWE